MVFVFLVSDEWCMRSSFSNMLCSVVVVLCCAVLCLCLCVVICCVLCAVLLVSCVLCVLLCCCLAAIRLGGDVLNCRLGAGSDLRHRAAVSLFVSLWSGWSVSLC